MAGGHIEVGPDGDLLAELPFAIDGEPIKTVITILLLVAVNGDAQVAFEVITTVIVEGFAKEVVV